MKKSVGILLMVAVAVYLLSCEKPNDPVLDNVYDRESANFIATATLQTNAVTDILALQATSGGRFANNFGSAVTTKGVCWSTQESPTIEDSCTNDGTGFGEFTSVLTNLLPSTTYYVRAYATNADGVAYGEQRSFTTMTGVTEFDISEPFGITATSVRVDVEVKADGGAPLLDWGVCLATQSGPTVDDLCLSAGSLGKMRVVSIDSSNQRDMVSGGGIPVGDANGIAAANASGSSPETLKVLSKGGLNLSLEISQTGSSASFSVENIQAGVRYYVRAYGYNEAVSHHYSQERTFSTFSGIADVDTRQISAVTAFTAIAGGAVTSGNGAEVTGRGVCLVDGDGAPGLDDRCIAAGEGLGEFSVDLTDLTPQQSYSVRAYATTSVGTSWGEVKSFTTTAIPPEVRTIAVSDITSQSARVTGEVTQEGSYEVTMRGFVWSTTQNPTVESHAGITSDGNGTGTFTSTLSGLSAGITYYVRAYATNSAGTSYGEQRSFTTMATLPLISTSQVSSITSSSAVSGGNVTVDGGAAVTARGVVWSTSQNPTLESNAGVSNDGSSTGVFTSSLTGLSPSTTYFVRAYATNSVGTSYGEQRSFTTLAASGGGRDTETIVVNVTNPATGRVWMDRNLGASRAATSSTDTQAYGDLYQWGRGADGHQKRNSPTTTTLSSTDQPGHGSFILTSNSPFDWRSPQNNNLWQGANGTNNPCPTGYRLPTEAEWNAERSSWSSSNASGAFNSPLKLPLAGVRDRSSGSLGLVGSAGRYWSRSLSGSDARFLAFISIDAGMLSSVRAHGHSVRCLRDGEPQVSNGYVWTKLLDKSSFPQSNLSYNTYTFDKERRTIYMIHHSTSSIYAFDIDQLTFNRRVINQSITNYGTILYNPFRNTIQLWRAGPDNVFEVSVNGGNLNQIVSGSSSSLHFGASPVFNGISKQAVTMFGYGFFRVRNSIDEVSGNQWVAKRADSSTEPYRRNTVTVLPNRDFSKVYFLDGFGNPSGNQREANCSISGGLNWASDVGKWCWLRDLWEHDFTTGVSTKILPVNSNFSETGRFGFDYDTGTFYSFGGYVPPNVHNQSITWRNTLRKYKPETDNGWIDVNQSGDIPSSGDLANWGAAASTDGLVSYYDSTRRRFIIISSNGIWELKL
jgi:hypothetical protein